MSAENPNPPLLRLLDEAGERVEIRRSGTVLGRGVSADVVVPETSLSREHVRFEYRSGSWQVIDLASANGTLVEGWKVTESPLHEGQVLQLGRKVFRVLGAGRLTTEQPVPAVVAPESAPVSSIPPPESPPPPAPELSPAERAINLLGVGPDAPRAEIDARYRALAAERELRRRDAAGSDERRQAEREITELDLAYETLVPELAAEYARDYPSLQPIVQLDETDSPSPVRPTKPAPSRPGVPVLLQSIVVATIFGVGLGLFFLLKAGRNETDLATLEREPGTAKILADSLEFRRTAALVESGALEGAPLRLCNTGSDPLVLTWVGAVQAAPDDGGRFAWRTFNSQFCEADFAIPLPPGREVLPAVKNPGNPKCSWDGTAIFWAIEAVRPGAESTPLRMSGIASRNSPCVGVNAGR